MNRYDHYKKAEQILQDVQDVTGRFREILESSIVSPQAILDYNRTQDIQLRIAQVHATLANTPDGVL